MSGPELSLVVSTVGRPVAFERLLRSVHESPHADHVELVLVDQSESQSCAAMLEDYQRGSWGPPRLAATIATTSARGASVGRNVGLHLASATIVGFPDDNAWYPSDTLRRIQDAFALAPDLAALSGRQTTLDGRDSMLRWNSKPGPVTRRNFLRTSIMSTMFFRRHIFDKVGHFDETMGVGSAGWYGAGEESDLLLRILGINGRVDYDPTLIVLQDEPRDDKNPKFVDKMLRYGCGMGHLWRIHHLPRTQLSYYAARKVAAAAVRGASGQHVTARADLAYLQGLLAGMRDRPPARLRRQQVSDAASTPTSAGTSTAVSRSDS